MKEEWRKAIEIPKHTKASVGKNTAIFNLNDVYQDIYYGNFICQMIKYIPRTKNN